MKNTWLHHLCDHMRAVEMYCLSHTGHWFHCGDRSNTISMCTRVNEKTDNSRFFFNWNYSRMISACCTHIFNFRPRRKLWREQNADAQIIEIRDRINIRFRAKWINEEKKIQRKSERKVYTQNLHHPMTRTEQPREMNMARLGIKSRAYTRIHIQKKLITSLEVLDFVHANEIQTKDEIQWAPWTFLSQ